MPPAIMDRHHFPPRLPVRRIGLGSSALAPRRSGVWFVAL
jgi:hypothetical protein